MLLQEKEEALSKNKQNLIFVKGVEWILMGDCYCIEIMEGIAITCFNCVKRLNNVPDYAEQYDGSI